ncbi:hypothetical protein GIY56_14250 [Paracoccus sp. YIM 132242]|uniref:C4-dicarboxylate ABC transporter n=1 Tax=Paracoccus lichenicola TaxID=2665644 RepID=A0A6L6HQK4_9RHOB|nr:hypothetical protein [Paracoccus lichenicola]MTE01446.1 hypothetical protein [Paracoccus lichenicola]
MPPRSARIGGILTALALLATIPHEYGAGQGFALVAAVLLIGALALFSLTAKLSRLAFVAVGIALAAWAAATRPDWAQATLTALTRGGFIIALFASLSALRSAAIGSQAILDCGRFLARQPPGRRYLALTVGGHLFGLILLYGSISLLGGLAAESTANEADQELRRHRLRRMLVAIQRGFASTLCWSPMALSMAVTLSVVQGASWPGAVGLCLVSSVLMIGIGWALDAVFKPTLRTPPPPRAVETDRWLARLRPLLVLLGIVVGGVFALHLATGVVVTGAVMTVVPLVAMAWILILPPLPGERAATLGARMGQFATRDLAGYRGEIILLFMAGFIGSLGSWLLVPIMQAHGPDLSAVPPLLILAALVWIIPLTGQIGMNPILAVSLLVPLLPAPAALGIHPTAMVVAITGGWAISGNTSPFTASVLLVGKLGGVEARHAGTRWNGLYAVAAGAALTLWVLIAAALL